MSEPFSLEEAKKLVLERIVVDANEVSDTVQQVVSACAAIVAQQVEKTLRQMGMTEGVAEKIQLLERENAKLLEACEGLIELIDAARMETLCQGSEWVAKLAKARAAVAKAKGESK